MIRCIETDLSDFISPNFNIIVISSPFRTELHKSHCTKLMMLCCNIYCFWICTISEHDVVLIYKKTAPSIDSAVLYDSHEKNFNLKPQRAIGSHVLQACFTTIVVLPITHMVIHSLRLPVQLSPCRLLYWISCSQSEMVSLPSD